jgi:hypothetical protein
MTESALRDTAPDAHLAPAGLMTAATSWNRSDQA